MTAIKASDLKVKFGPVSVLENIGFEIEAGDFVAVVGPNGAGKTTLIRAVLGLDPIAGGRVELFGRPLPGFSEWERIGYLPQNVGSRHRLLPLTGREIAALGLLPRRKAAGTDGVGGRLEETAARLGVGGLLDRPFSELSGGEQQKVMLCRALVGDPELLILDEPTAALAPQARDDFYDFLKTINTEKGTTILFITHDAGYLGHYAKKLMYVDKTLVFYGRFDDFCRSETMAKHFGPYSQHLICGQHDH